MPGLIGASTGYMERQKGKGFVESSSLQRFGRGGAAFNGGGQIFAGLGTQGNGADTTEDTLYTATLPANVFDIVGRCVTLQAFGNITATSATKNARVYFGAGVIATCTYLTTTTGAWQTLLYVWKSGPNTQVYMSEIDSVGAATTRNVTTAVNGAEVDTAPIVCKVTGQSSVGTASTVTCNGFIISGYN